jgi:uroporphyrinogen decarboxylase
MEPELLKQGYGDRLCFWGGGCDTRNVLPNGTPQQVADHVRQLVDTMSPGGGFVFQQVHNIMADVPPENVVAMFEAVNG